MVDRYNPPARAQIAAMANGDDRMVRALEKLFRSGGQELPDIKDNLDALALQVAQNALNIAINADDIAANTARIKTNEVLLWLSM